MDKKYLDKVVDKSVSETYIDYKIERIYFPVPSRLFTSFTIFTNPFFLLPPLVLLTSQNIIKTNSD